MLSVEWGDGESVAGRRVVISGDGGRVRRREPKRGPKTKKGRRRYRGAWREPKLLTVYGVDAKGKRAKSFAPVIDGTRRGPEAWPRLLRGYLQSLQLEQADQVLFVADGAHGIGNRVGTLIKALNPKLRGWANDYRHSAASKTFAYADHRVWQMLWHWAKRRHPNKPSQWVKARYFKADGYWTFHESNAQLGRHSAVPITRYVKVTGRSSPIDPEQRTYWTQRKKRQVARTLHQGKRLAMLRDQNHTCMLCGVGFCPGDPIDEHHRVPRHQGGSDALANRGLVHRWCHHAHHQRQGYKAVEARAV